MWSRRSVVAVVEATPALPVVPPVQVSVEPRMSDEDRKIYVEKAKSVGVVNGPLKQEMLVAFLKRSGLGSYPLTEVESYLDQVFGRPKEEKYEQPKWGWRPLREEDDGKLTNHRDAYANGGIMRGVYQGAVPFPVLETVERIIEAVPGVHFYVSDQAIRPEGDPFLAVNAAGMNMIVVERWDEPSFRA